MLSKSGEKYAQIKQCLKMKTVLNKYVGDFDLKAQQEIDFFTGGRVIMDFGQKWQFEVKMS